MNQWHQFNQNTAHNPPRELYRAAVKFATSSDSVTLDIGAGAGNETKDMLLRGFKVVAIDANPELLEIAEAINSPNLRGVVSRMENYDYGSKKYDFVVAMFALPFIEPSQFTSVFERILDSLKPGGVFTFHLFGVNDEWSANNKMTFLTTEAAQALFGDNTQLLFKEVKYNGKMANGENKHWHIFECILEKT